MKPEVVKLLNAAKADMEFQEELKKHEPNRYKLNWFSDLFDKSIYASLYMGWLIGKGRYDENDYK